VSPADGNCVSNHIGGASEIAYAFKRGIVRLARIVAVIRKMPLSRHGSNDISPKIAASMAAAMGGGVWVLSAQVLRQLEPSPPPRPRTETGAHQQGRHR
jgi:hypothetical protein